MSSRSERVVTHVVIGEGATPEIDALLSALAASGAQVRRLRLRGEQADGKLLLAAVAASDQVICSPWPDRATAPAGRVPGHSGQEGAR